MERFIQMENIKRYRELLTHVTDDGQRRLILRLLAEEEAKKVPSRSDEA